MEPNLEFELTKKSTEEKHIRIIFDLESRPQNADDEKEYFVDCVFNNDELKLIAKELEKEAEQYPTRAI
jgi:hypothetical protein